MDFGISWDGGQYAYVSADMPKFKNTLYRLKNEHPDDVIFIAGNPDNPDPARRENDGCLYAKVPANWIRIKPPVKRNLTEEQKEALRERVKLMHERRKDMLSDANEISDLDLEDEDADLEDDLGEEFE